jgi:ribosome-associated protein
MSAKEGTGMTPIQVSYRVVVPSGALSFRAVRSSGPGGQNVNKVATAVQLRFDAARSPSLPEEVRRRLMHLAGSRLTVDGEIVIDARRYRSQEQNRQDAVLRLTVLVRRAAEPPKPRRKTRPTAAARERRLAAKKRRSRIKGQRGRVSGED